MLSFRTIPMNASSSFIAAVNATAELLCRQRELSELLLAASVHHMHSMMEDLPVGQLSFDYQGHLKQIDDYSCSLLGLTDRNLSKPVTLKDLLSGETPDLLDSFRKGDRGHCHWVSLRTVHGVEVAARLVLTESLEPFRYECAIIYSSDCSSDANRQRRAS